jgi:hypothetical protein
MKQISFQRSRSGLLFEKTTVLINQGHAFCLHYLVKFHSIESSQITRHDDKRWLS